MDGSVYKYFGNIVERQIKGLLKILISLDFNEIQSLENIERQEKSGLGEEDGEEEDQGLLLLGKHLLLLLLDLAGGLHLGGENGEDFGLI